MASNATGGASSSPPAPTEPRWTASLAIVAALFFSTTLPETLTIQPGWVIPVLEGALLIALQVTAPSRQRGERRLIRSASLLLIALLNLAIVVSLALLVHVVVTGGPVTGARSSSPACRSG